MSLIQRWNGEGLRRLDKEALIDLILAQAETIKALTARVGELEAKLGLPPKTPENSSLPPSKGQKSSAAVAPKPKTQAHAGAHRPLHPKPTSRRKFRAAYCQRCGVDAADAPQLACESYDRIEIPAIIPDVTRVTLMGGLCPCCGKRFKATPPPDLTPGSPFGDNLHAFVIYLRSVQGIALARLVVALRDLFGLEISECALVAILDDSRPAFARQTSAIKARLFSGSALACDETGVRVGKANLTVQAKRRALMRDLDAILVAETACHLTRELLDKVARARDQLLTFCDFLGKVEATNNVGERGLRPCVIQREVTNSYRAKWAAHFEAGVRTAIDTACLAGAGPFQTLLNVIHA